MHNQNPSGETVNFIGNFGGGITIENNQFDMGSTDVKVKAKFEKIGQVVFKNYDGTELQNSYFAYGETPVYSGETPSKSSEDLHKDYVFSGWNSELDPVNSDSIVYTATYQEVNYYLVSFEANGGSGSMETARVPVGGNEYTISELDFSAPDGKALKGWSICKVSDSIWTDYQTTRPTFTVTGDMIARAIWEDSSIHTKVYPAGAGVAVYNINESEFTATAKDGYEFQGWLYSDTYGAGSEDYVSTSRVYKPNYVNEGTYTAHFKPIIYTVSVIDDGNGTVSASHISGKIGTVVTLTAEPKEGYQFKEWEVISGNVIISNNRFTIGASNVEIKGHFERNTVTTYDIQVTAPSFDALNIGYTKSVAKPITIRSLGNRGVTIASVGLSGSGKDSFILDDSGVNSFVPAGGTNTTYFIKPKEGLSAGTHTATIIVTNNEGETARAQVSVKVYDSTAYTVNLEHGTGGGSFTAGTTVTIKADEAPSGKVFDKWVSKDVNFADAYSASTSFIMPAKAVTVTATFKEKKSQELEFAYSQVKMKIGDEYVNSLNGAKTSVSYKSDNEAVAKVDKDGKVTAIALGTAVITAAAAETDEYFAGTADFTVTVEKKEGNTEEPDKVPLTEFGQRYASPEDNFAAVAPGSADGVGGSIKKLILDFSNVHASNVDPLGLKMTAISGSKFTTREKLKDEKSMEQSGGVKVKVNKKTRIPTITCMRNGSANLIMEDGSTYTITFTVQKPKPQKAANKLPVGGVTVAKTIKELFGTDIDGGTLKIVKQKVGNQATVLKNRVQINPALKDSIKLQYQYLDKKYNLTIRIK